VKSERLKVYQGFKRIRDLRDLKGFLNLKNLIFET
jgi:hypothetical protein